MLNGYTLFCKEKMSNSSLESKDQRGKMKIVAQEWREMTTEIKDQYKKRAKEVNEKTEMKLEEANSNTATLVGHSAFEMSINGDENFSDTSSEVSSFENSEDTLKNSIEINQIVS